MDNSAFVLIPLGILMMVIGVILYPTLISFSKPVTFASFIVAALPFITGVIMIIVAFTGNYQHKTIS